MSNPIARAAAIAYAQLPVAVQFTILGSGSGGNCAYLETGETRLLIDAGFSGRQIRERLATLGRAPESLHGRVFTTGATFEVGDVRIDTFSIPHDAYDPVGFLIHAGGHKIGFLTDLGHATRLVCERVRASNVLVLETNHDLKMLQDDPRRPWSLKQ